MLRDLCLWTAKMFFQMVIWVYILSFSWQGQSLFDRAQEILVKNEVIEYVSDESHMLYRDLLRKAKYKIASLSGGNEEELESY